MLLVEAGWQDEPVGRNGESRFVAWRDAFALLRRSYPDDHASTVALLMSSVDFPDGVARPLAYPLPDAAVRDDIGVRLNSRLREHLEREFPGAAKTEAVSRLCRAAQQSAHRVRLASGDLVVMDNNRRGHGRDTVIGKRLKIDGTFETNPRSSGASQSPS
jgi:hypothetical protein